MDEVAVRALVAEMISMAVSAALSPINVRIQDLSGSVDILRSGCSGNSSALATVQSDVARLAADVGQLMDPGDAQADETGDARNAHVDYVLTKYFGGENDKPPVA